MDFRPVCFQATQEVIDDLLPIYHTNVIMCIADKYAVACLSSVRNSAERETLKRELTESGKEIIEISIEQMNHFAGNMLQLKNNDGDKFVVLSESAYNSLSESQISSLEKFNKLIVAPVPTIEKYGGGSVRCMIAEVF